MSINDSSKLIKIREAAEMLGVNPETLRVLSVLSKSMSHKQAVMLTSQITGVSKNQLYKITMLQAKG